MENNKVEVNIDINGKSHMAHIPPNLTLLDFLREHIGLVGTKRSCDNGNCGACTVLMDGRTVYSCITLAVQASGKKIVTIEGLSNNEEGLHPIQQAFIEENAIQCGFCTPGMIMSAKGLLDKNHNPSVPEIKEALSGNLCRCTGYTKIINAVTSAAIKLKSAKENKEHIDREGT